MRLTKRSMMFPAMLLVLYSTYLSSLAILLVPSVIVSIVIQLTGMVLFALSAKRLDAFRLKLDIPAGVCLAVLVLVCAGYAKNEVYRGEFVVYVFSLLFVLIAKDETNWIRPFIGLNALSGLFYIGTTLLMRASRSLYLSIVPALYPNESRFTYWYDSGYMTGITEHTTTNSCMLGMALIFFVGCWMAAPAKSGRRLRWLALSVLALLCIFLTGKRALLLFPVLALLLAYYCYKSDEKNHFLKFLILIAGLGVLLVLAYFFIPQVQAVLHRFTNMGEDENIRIRYAIWDAVLEAFRREPLLGIGWFGVSTQVAPLVGGRSGHAHNVYLQLLCETGIVGTVILCGWMLYALVSTLRLLRSAGRNKALYPEHIRAWIFISAAFQLYFVMYCLTENPLYDVYVYPVYYTLSMSAVSARKKFLQAAK